jgi:sugar lactone lactonase YvrE
LRPDRLRYANKTLAGDAHRYDRIKGKIGGPRVLFGNVIRPDAPSAWKGPDGMAISVDGRLFVAVFGQKDVTVLGAKGKVVEQIPTAGRLLTNIAFALPGRKRIHLTEYECGQVQAFDVTADGLPLWTGPETTRMASVG